MPSRPVVCVTGIGVASSLGLGKGPNWEKLTAGQSGIRTIRRFETKGLQTTIGGTIDCAGWGGLPFPLRTQRVAECVINEAVAEARLPAKDVPAQLFLGLPPIEMSWAEILRLACDLGAGKKIAPDKLIRPTSEGSHQQEYSLYAVGGVAARLVEKYGTRGPPAIVNTACSTGATVIELAVESIRRGQTELALAVAADASITPDAIVRFGLLAALSMSKERPESAAKPFSLDRDGFVMGEGAAAVVLETPESAKRRAVLPLGFVTGVGETSDPFHVTRSTPGGAPIAAAMRAAIADACLAPEHIGYVNAHGTGTKENDRVEAAALKSVFGSFANCPPISSNKSMIGHTMSAAGLIEVVFSLLSIRHGILPPTINYHVPDPELPLDVVPNTARNARVCHAVSNSFGFGGQNVAVVLSRDPPLI
jgi:3-oxoacyl-[acyl-carrier-protein] synthase II